MFATFFAVITFVMLLSRIFQEPLFRKRMPLYLLFLLYLAAFGTLKLWQDARPELKVFIFTCFAAAALWLPGESIWLSFQKSKEEKRSLHELKKLRGPYYEILLACQQLASGHRGALIVLERTGSLEIWAQKGIALNARVSKELLFSIFTPPGALHDGAVIIRKDQIASAGVIVPLTRNAAISKDLGTRHRAAVGMSEATDALCLIVSEETGALSLADRGSLYYDVDETRISEILLRGLKFKLEKPKGKKAEEHAGV